MRFFADAMLGKLARWLRALGYDTAYESGIEDGELVRRASEEERLILTRDTRLVGRLARGGYLFIRDNDPSDQLRQAVTELGLKPRGPGLMTRCLECNTQLMRADRESVRGAVPEYTYLATGSFKRCPGCGRVYWPGTHLDRMLARLKSALGE